MEQIEEIKKCMHAINRSIVKYIKEHVGSQIVGEISLELVLELLNFINLISEDKGFEEYDAKADLQDLSISIEGLIGMCDEGGKQMGRIDLNSHLFKKKVKPLMDKIKEVQVQKSEQGMLVEAE